MKKTSRKLSLREIVGDPVYSVWLDMLKRLVPSGRTHRLAPLVAAMLQYAVEVAGENTQADSVADRLIAAYDEGHDEEAVKKLLPIVRNLFRDAGVESERVAKSGEEYSIAEQAIQEYFAWFNYEWD